MIGKRKKMPRFGEVLKTVTSYKAITVAFLLIIIGGLLIYFREKAQNPSSLLVAGSEVGKVLITSGVIGLLYQVALLRSFLAEVQEQLAGAISRHLSWSDQIRQSGVERIYDRLPNDQVVEAFESATSRIRILQTAIPNLVTLEDAIVKAAANQANIEILVLSKDSALVEKRSTDLSYGGTTSFAANIQYTHSELRRFVDKCGLVDRVQVKTYDRTPTITIYSADSICYQGYLLQNTHSLLGPWHKITDDHTFMSKALHAHFDALWESGTYLIGSPESDDHEADSPGQDDNEENAGAA